MKPPICEVCNERFDPGAGELIAFVDDAAALAYDERAKQPGFVGHRPNRGWFCGEHVAAAGERSATMTLGAAVRDITGVGEITPKRETAPAIAVDPFVPTPDVQFAELVAVERPVARRIVAEATRVLREAVAAIASALGVEPLTRPGSRSSAGTRVALFQGADVAVFLSSSADDARLLVQRGGRSLLDVVVDSGADATTAADGLALLDRASVRCAQSVAAVFVGVINDIIDALEQPADDPFDLSPDIDGVDLHGGEIRRGIAPGSSSIEWRLDPVPAATTRRWFVELIPQLFHRLDLGEPPVLERTTRREWVPMDGSFPPNCPFVDHVRHAAEDADDRVLVSVETDQAHWSDDNISNVSTHLSISIDGTTVRAYAAGRDNQDACTSLTLVRPTSAIVVELITAAFASVLR